MVQNNATSLEIDFNHLAEAYPPLAVWVSDEPLLIFPLLNGIAMYVAN